MCKTNKERHKTQIQNTDTRVSLIPSSNMAFKIEL